METLSLPPPYELYNSMRKIIKIEHIGIHNKYAINVNISIHINKLIINCFWLKYNKVII